MGCEGHNDMQAAKVRCARRIIAIDTVADKEPAARMFGATDFTLAGPDVDAVARIRAELPTEIENVVGSFGEGGVDYAFECVGHPDLLNAALEMLDWGGTAVAVGVPAPTATVPARVTNFTHVERTLTGSRAGSHRPPSDIPLIVDAYPPGLIQLHDLVTPPYPIPQLA